MYEIQVYFLFQVHSPPEIEPITETLEVLEGETASLTCKATGKPQPTYRWTKQNTLEVIKIFLKNTYSSIIHN